MRAGPAPNAARVHEEPLVWECCVAANASRGEGPACDEGEVRLPSGHMLSCRCRLCGLVTTWRRIERWRRDHGFGGAGPPKKGAGPAPGHVPVPVPAIISPESESRRCARVSGPPIIGESVRCWRCWRDISRFFSLSGSVQLIFRARNTGRLSSFGVQQQLSG